MTSLGSARQPDAVGKAADLAGQQHHVRRRLGSFRALVHGDGNLSLGQHGRVVHPIAGHGDDGATLLQSRTAASLSSGNMAP
jgi:hypothetical protein